MITSTTTTFRSDDMMEELVRVEVELPTGTNNSSPIQRVHFHIGADSMHMNWKQFEAFVQKIVVAWDAEKQRRAHRRNELGPITSMDVEVGDAIKLGDNLGNEKGGGI